jgi:hypothetical protein
MLVTIGSKTAGEASFIMNFILLFSLIFTGELPGQGSLPHELLLVGGLMASPWLTPTGRPPPPPLQAS